MPVRFTHPWLELTALDLIDSHHVWSNTCHLVGVQDPVQASCGDTFCRGCIQEYMDGAAAEAGVACPTCSRPLTVSLNQVPL